VVGIAVHILGTVQTSVTIDVTGFVWTDDEKPRFSKLRSLKIVYGQINSVTKAVKELLFTELDR